MFCASDIFGWEVWFSRDEEIEIPDVAKSRVAKSCLTQDPNHTLQLMNISAIRVFSNPAPLNPAWTWTHQRNDQNMWFNKLHQSIETCNIIGITSKTMHCHECSRSPANTITSNSEPKTIIQNEQLHIDITKQKCWPNTHVSLPCSFSPTTHQLWIELNVEIPENPNNNDRWKQNANAETALPWSEHTNQKILREILGFLNKGKLAVVKPRWQFTSWTFRQFVCFPIQPICFRWSDERIIETDADVKTDMNVDFHIQKGKSHCTLIHPWRQLNFRIGPCARIALTLERHEVALPRNPVDNLSMALDMNCRSLQMRRRFFCGSKIKLLHVPCLAGNLMVQCLRSSILQNASTTSTYVGAASTVLIWLRAKWGTLRETGADCFGLSLFEYRRGKLFQWTSKN